MPLYEYECPQCGTRVEVLQKTGEDGSLLKCRHCGAEGLNRLLSGCVVKTGGSGKTACSPGAGGFT
ncbi:MAG: zinc ribbon domain-containing protein [Deltaproteobacteria bacterium]|nr:zinc ribbon domain-containing protein [Deltaproteobacteria bacterium]